ncbi:EAL domain-containing protein [Thiohalorhabdus sp. Cl-TMA]|uniref:EAL domain-containing protein n=1 Tax=Thiohalorhabdus methylotrophus TaxID=3242694 RepID=A0ABV4TWP8_9GAMM
MTDGWRAACPNCERMPDRIDGPGRLLLWSPLGHTRGKLLRLLGEAGLAWEERDELGALMVGLEAGAPPQLAGRLRPGLSGVELDHVRALYLPGETEPGPGDYGRVAPLGQWLAAAEAGWLVDMMAEKRLTSHFQPIVEARDPSRIFAFEALLRGLQPDGGVVGGGPIVGLAAEADLLFQLDLAARRSAVAAFAGQGSGERRVFINFTPTSIYDPAYCLQTTFRAVEEAGLRPDQVVFEVTESERVGDMATLTDVLGYYREAGFGVALDDLGSGYASLNLLHVLQPDFVKLDMELIRDVDRQPHKAALAGKLLEATAAMGIRSVAEGVETPGECQWVREHGADLIQGFLIGRPGPELAKSGWTA